MNDDEDFVDRCRQQARALQHELRSSNEAEARAAAVRLSQLPRFRVVSLRDLLDGRVIVLRADALAVIAIERGFQSWPMLLHSSLPGLRSVTMHTDGMGGFLNRWFVDYDEAAASLREEGGYLLPYRQQFYITVAGAIQELGMDPDDPDWARIGFDWVRPRDAEAHLRLCRVRLLAMVARGEDLA